MINPKKKLFSYLMLTSLTLPLLTSKANSEVIIPTNTTVNEGETVETGITQIGGSDTFTFTQDFSCSTSNTYYKTTNDRTSPLIWACIDALSDSVGTTSSGSSSTSSSTDSAARSNINNLGNGVAASTALTTA